MLQEADALADEVVGAETDVFQSLAALDFHQLSQGFFEFLISAGELFIFVRQGFIDYRNLRHVGGGDLPIRGATDGNRLLREKQPPAVIEADQDFLSLPLALDALGHALQEQMPEHIAIAESGAPDVLHGPAHGFIDEHRFSIVQAKENPFLQGIHGLLDRVNGDFLMVGLAGFRQQKDEANGQKAHGEKPNPGHAALENWKK